MSGIRRVDCNPESIGEIIFSPASGLLKKPIFARLESSPGRHKKRPENEAFGIGKRGLGKAGSGGLALEPALAAQAGGTEGEQAETGRGGGGLGDGGGLTDGDGGIGNAVVGPLVDFNFVS